MAWNSDMASAPRGETEIVKRKVGKNTVDVEAHQPVKVILAGKCGVVTASYYIPDEDRWNMFSANEQPIAWMLWPEHPEATQ